MTADGFRRLALALPGVEEGAHMSHPDFRVGGRIFATMGHPKPGWAMVALTPDNQAAFMAMHPEAFVPVKGKWGEQGMTNVNLRHARVPAVREALKSAWEGRVSKSAESKRGRRK